MYQIKRLGLLVLTGIFVLVALFGAFRFGIEVGESPLHFVIQDAGVFAAGLLGMALCWRQGRRIRARREADLEAARVFTGHSLEASVSWARQVPALLLLGAFGAIFLWMYLAKTQDWRLLAGAVVTLGFLLVAVPMALSQHPRGRPTFRVDGRGLSHAWFGDIPWDQVHGLCFRSTRTRHVTLHSLFVGVARPQAYVARAPGVVRLLRGKWMRRGGRYGSLEIPLQGLDKDPELLANAARELRGRTKPGPVTGWFPEMSEEAIDLALELDYLAENADRLPEAEVVERLKSLEPRMFALAKRPQLN